MSFSDRWKYLHLAYLSKPLADRSVYRLIRRQRPAAIVEIGVGAALRSQRMLHLAARLRPADRIQFTAIDPFEMSPKTRDHLGLKAAHQLLAQTGAKVQLVPGDPLSALSRVANSLRGTELVVISADQQGDSLARAWFYIPRMLAPGGCILIEEPGESGTRFRAIDSAELARLAQADTRRRAAA